MARPCLFISIAVGLLAAIVVTSHGRDFLQPERASSSSLGGPPQARTGGDVDAVEEEAESPDPRSRQLRKSKNIRYNTGGSDLTMRKPNTEYFMEHIWPRGLTLVPASESTVIAIGSVVKMQPYLSEDHSRIYTEISIQVEELPKSDKKGSMPLGGRLIIDRLGGALKLRSGQIIRDDISIEGLGKTQVGGRYVLFARRINKGHDLGLIKGYELRDGRVFRLTEDGSRSSVLVSTTEGVPETYSHDETFLDVVRQAVRRSRP